MEKEIFKIQKDIIRARALKEMAEDRFLDIRKEIKTYKIIEEYYEIIKELITAIMYKDGFKTLGHIELIIFLENNYSKRFIREEFRLIDELRKMRHNIVYYGEKVDILFLKNKEERLNTIINKLNDILDKDLN